MLLGSPIIHISITVFKGYINSLVLISEKYYLFYINNLINIMYLCRLYIVLYTFLFIKMFINEVFLRVVTQFVAILSIPFLKAVNYIHSFLHNWSCQFLLVDSFSKNKAS